MGTPSKRILIIEDELPIRQVLRQELEKQNFSVYEAQNGEEGLGAALAQRPDLILLDIMMPKMHWIEVLDRLRKDSWGALVPVILLTNYAEDPRVRQAVDAGQCEMMEKEKVKLTDIIGRIRETLGM